MVPVIKVTILSHGEWLERCQPLAARHNLGTPKLLFYNCTVSVFPGTQNREPNYTLSGTVKSSLSLIWGSTLQVHLVPPTVAVTGNLFQKKIAKDCLFFSFLKGFAAGNFPFFFFFLSYRCNHFLFSIAGESNCCKTNRRCFSIYTCSFACNTFFLILYLPGKIFIYLRRAKVFPERNWMNELLERSSGDHGSHCWISALSFTSTVVQGWRFCRT